MLLSPLGTVVVAVIIAILASVITTILVGGGRPATAGPTATLVTSGGASAAPSAAGGTDTAAPASSTLGAAAAKVAPAVVLIESSGISGSAFIVSAEGWLLTNHHVVGVDKRVKVTLADGRSLMGTVTAVDTLTDLALIRIKLAGLPVVELGESAGLAVGDQVMAVGNPLGAFANTVTSGVVSGLSRGELLDDNGEYRNLIQTDAAINHGNSGGPLADLSGRVVGINTLAIGAEFGAEGLGFAIPIDVARPIIDQAIAGKPLTRPYLGVRYVSVDRGVQERQKLTVDHGALLAPQVGSGNVVRPAVEPGSPAAKAGLRRGDVIVAIDDQTIDGTHPLEVDLVRFAAGDTVTLHIVRDGQDREIAVTLGTRR